MSMAWQLLMDSDPRLDVVLAVISIALVGLTQVAARWASRRASRR